MRANLVVFVLVVLAVAGCCHAATEFNGLALLLLKDFDMKDGQVSQLSKQYSTLQRMLKSKVGKFRNASPHPTASFASYLTGRYPAHLSVSGKDGDVVSLGPERDRVTLFSVLRSQGYQVAHFGEWPFKEVLSELVDRSFISFKPNEVADAAVEWIDQVKAQKQKFFLSILWPKSDLTFSLGGKYNPSKYRGAIGNSEDSLCKDVQRRKSDPPRYKTCARLIYLVNRQHDLFLQNKVIKALFQVPKTFVGFSTVSGNESPLVDGKLDIA